MQMNCAWEPLISLLPLWMREKVDMYRNRMLQELRLRSGLPPELVTGDGVFYLERPITKQDLTYCVNVASRYSPWVAQTAASGYITAPGGHRIGLCGRAVMHGQTLHTVDDFTSLCIRVARDLPGIAVSAAKIPGSVLILGKPGNGKTTLLRDLIRCRSDLCGQAVAVADEREEIFPKHSGAFCFSTGKRVDILSGCPKGEGVTNLLRTMSPDVIAVDEVTARNDCDALISAGWCGVELLATAHADCVSALHKRPVYKPLLESGIFKTALVMRSDKSWKVESICQ